MHLWFRRRGYRYGIAVLATALGAMLQSALPEVLGRTPFLAFYPAVVAAGGFGGMGRGLLDTVGSVLYVGLLFDATPGWDHLADPLVLGRLAVFLAGGAGISIVAGLRQSAAELRDGAAQALAEQYKFMHSVIESLPHPFYVIDARDYTVKMANSAAGFGKLPPDATCYALTHRSDGPCSEKGEACPLDQIRVGGKPVVVEPRPGDGTARTNPPRGPQERKNIFPIHPPPPDTLSEKQKPQPPE
jgi:hypothetical protein